MQNESSKYSEDSSEHSSYIYGVTIHCTCAWISANSVSGTLLVFLAIVCSIELDYATIENIDISKFAIPITFASFRID